MPRNFPEYVIYFSSNERFFLKAEQEVMTCMLFAQRANFFVMDLFFLLACVISLARKFVKERVKMAEVAYSPNVAYAFMSSFCQSDWNQASYYPCTLATSMSPSMMLVAFISWSPA